jgi:hypothetical protein
MSTIHISKQYTANFFEALQRILKQTNLDQHQRRYIPCVDKTANAVPVDIVETFMREAQLLQNIGENDRIDNDKYDTGIRDQPMCTDMVRHLCCCVR